MIPNPFSHITYPVVDPDGSNPCEDPKIVTPKFGVSQFVYNYFFDKDYSLSFDLTGNLLT